jgi:agmatine deiminase
MSNDYFPPEWHPQAWLWIGFPHLSEEWPGFLPRAQEQIAAFANAVAESGQRGIAVLGCGEAGAAALWRCLAA